MFLPPAQDGSFIFEQPRTEVPTQTGLRLTRYTGVSFWRGTLQYEPKRDPGPLLAQLQAADKQGGFFFADLRKPGVKPPANPVWHTALTPFATHYFMLPSASVPAPSKGDIISLRANIAADYMTARQVVEVFTYSNGQVEVRFNQPIPTEFLTDAFSSQLQVCYNRPHVRAVFDRDTLRYRIGTNKTATISNLSWREDTAGIQGRLVRLQATADTREATFITAENGDFIQAEDGEFLVAE